MSNTDEEVKKEDELIDQVISHAFLAQSVYAKVSFDNAKDTNELLAVAQSNADMMLVAVRSRIIPFVDELLENKLRDIIDEADGKVAITLGDGRFTVVEIEEEL